MKSLQSQKMIERRLDTKLDKITELLSTILEKMDKEDSELDKKTIKRIAKEWKGIDSGRVKVHHYSSLKDFDRAIG